MSDTAAQTAPPLLQATAIAKSFAGVHALRNASFELRRGEVHALVGENGAGKSTLIKVFTGALLPDSGTIHVAGEPVLHNSPRHARALGIAAIYQQPSLFPHLTIAENIGLSLEPSGLWRKVNWQQRVKCATDLLTRSGSSMEPDRIVETLSMPEQQVVEIAKAIGAGARILIMDEPTASLSDREVERLFIVIRQLQQDGVGIIYISHRLDEISQIAHRVTVLRDGQTIGTRPIDGVSREELIRMMVGRDIAAVFPKRSTTMGEVALEVRNLKSEQLRVRDVSLSVRRGEILGIAGLVGSGRTEVAQLLFGLAQPDSGEILRNGSPVHLQAPADAIRHGIAYVPEDRRQHGVILSLPLTANTTLATLPSVSRNGLIDTDQESALTRTYVDRLQVKTASIHTEAGMLSGGNQQKVAIARWLVADPQVIILDEPTQGVDVGSKSEIHKLMVDLAEQGRAIIMISSELPEILGMSDRIAVMHEGAIAAILKRDEATQQNILSLALGHSLSESIKE
ncbi:MAG TPA: sugar ABC transporter ATP-binding protein [Bryobacteraceae bacterium]|nr:sugar ABC transporter ATP-binding protein [Bryobacteraceae bacterium]